jgi:predicted HTH transcriptional regulator
MGVYALLTERSQEMAGWLDRKSARSGAGGAGLRSLLDQPETQQLERKSSFLASTDPKHSDIPQYVIQHKVEKSVAALANTDGGYVITGQADDLTIVGLADDFAQITKNSGRDGFELRLVEYINTSLHPGWAILGLHVHWLDHDGLAVAIVEVPRSEAIVHLTDRKNKDDEAVYVRSGTRSDKLAGRELSEWIKRGRRR